MDGFGGGGAGGRGRDLCDLPVIDLACRLLGWLAGLTKKSSNVPDSPENTGIIPMVIDYEETYMLQGTGYNMNMTCKNTTGCLYK
jgi:hypothetical protein